MVQRVSTVAFEGIEARSVDVQVQVAPGLPHFAMVGLPDKAVSEAKERVRAALVASGLALPARRITVNLAPADLPKEGSHYDLPIALALMAEIGAIPSDAIAGMTVVGELAILFCFIFLYMAAAGPGAWSIDEMRTRRPRR